MTQEPRLLDQVRDRFRHYSIRTEQAYRGWICRFILFHRKRHPRDIGASEVETFLPALAPEYNVVMSAQNQALSAILFLHYEVLEGGYLSPTQGKPSAPHSPNSGPHP